MKQLFTRFFILRIILQRAEGQGRKGLRASYVRIDIDLETLILLWIKI